jgi:hypothetical protein
MQSIQRVFSSIRIEQVCLYLHRAGWTKSLNGERLDFEKTADTSQETSRVFLPASSSHPRFRRLLPNLIFSVSILEEREPIEVASEMASLTTDEPAAISPALPTSEMIERVVLRNSSAAPLQIIVGDNLVPHQLLAGEELLVARNHSACVIELTSNSAIRLSPSHLLLGLPPLAAHTLADSLRSWFEESFPADIAATGPEGPSTGISLQAEQLLMQFCFAVESLANLVDQPIPLLRAGAVLLCGVSQLLPDNATAQARLFQLARQLLTQARLTFELKHQLAQQLWQVARSDQPVAPMETLAWLNKESRPTEIVTSR